MSIKVTIKDGTYKRKYDKKGVYLGSKKSDYVESFNDDELAGAFAIFFSYIEDGYSVTMEYKAKK